MRIRRSARGIQIIFRIIPRIILGFERYWVSPAVTHMYLSKPTWCWIASVIAQCAYHFLLSGVILIVG